MTSIAQLQSTCGHIMLQRRFIEKTVFLVWRINIFITSQFTSIRTKFLLQLYPFLIDVAGPFKLILE